MLENVVVGVVLAVCVVAGCGSESVLSSASFVAAVSGGPCLAYLATVLVLAVVDMDGRWARYRLTSTTPRWSLYLGPLPAVVADVVLLEAPLMVAWRALASETMTRAVSASALWALAMEKTIAKVPPDGSAACALAGLGRNATVVVGRLAGCALDECWDGQTATAAAMAGGVEVVGLLSVLDEAVGWAVVVGVVYVVAMVNDGLASLVHEGMHAWKQMYVWVHKTHHLPLTQWCAATIDDHWVERVVVEGLVFRIGVLAFLPVVPPVAVTLVYAANYVQAAINHSGLYIPADVAPWWLPWGRQLLRGRGDGGPH
ncbi:uncharacterized protein AMSG_10653 [Thecamonas trahens ATCC 50062]|uniref:Fatty acid hydroxylase domain-containing protein n=1 Tax=Thecamonas trahens ATCC 50062 TaxID=461836 RepID=A0A0L0DS38_THETB|nr:hypothetical protein AMSG_10653 [Thecamonas trahens ATCC 50062]KNC55057.1 hypothetical protein AMSG_10653 [Thecamonas trahens ATCC 50062]|eukprot:XP_013753361.1 hypothetical protein AMSG_10653 [Thecamonas trahens ATCC 50062]